MGLSNPQEKIMFQDMYKNYLMTPDAFIDVLQNTKKNISNEIFTDKTLSKIASDFIDAQTTFAKSMVKINTTLAKHAIESVSPKSN